MIKDIKISYKILLRSFKDFFYGNYWKFAKKTNKEFDFNFKINLTQEIKSSNSFENKLYNLDLASKAINQIVIKPDEIFSFWRIIKNPKKNYKKSRVIINGETNEDYGGGLCQISGIIYHLSLISGLEIIERYNHSIDIYTNETRFTPLGLDATVVYAYKDFRIKNNFKFPIKFKIEIINNQLIASLISHQEILKNKINIEVQEENNLKTVKIFNKNGNLVSTSNYKYSV